MKKKMNINTIIVGLGNWGEQFIPILNQYSCLVALVDKNINKLKALKEKYNLAHLAIYDALDPLLDDSSIDAVFISTPWQQHYDLVLKTLQHKKHCFVEKPFVLRFEESERIFAEIKKHQFKVNLMVGYLWNFNLDLKTLFQFLFRKKNEIQFMKIIANNFSFQEPLYISVLPHLLDFFLFLLFFNMKVVLFQIRIFYKKISASEERLQIQFIYDKDKILLLDISKSIYPSFELQYKENDSKNIMHIPINLWKDRKDDFQVYDYYRKSYLNLEHLFSEDHQYPWNWSMEAYKKNPVFDIKKSLTYKNSLETFGNSNLNDELYFFLKSIEKQFIPQNYLRLALPYRLHFYDYLIRFKDRNFFDFTYYPVLRKSVLDSHFNSNLKEENPFKHTLSHDILNQLDIPLDFVLGIKEDYISQEGLINYQANKKRLAKNWVKKFKNQHHIIKQFNIEDESI